MNSNNRNPTVQEALEIAGTIILIGAIIYVLAIF